MRFRALTILISSYLLAGGTVVGCNGASSDEPGTSDGGSGGSSASGASSHAGGGMKAAGGAEDSAGGAEETAGGAGGAESCEVDTSYMPNIDPADFVANVDNPYWPLVPGTKWLFEGGGEYVEVVVLEETKEILGIPTVVVRDTLRDGSADAPILEDTYDWYAQDKAGNVWYMGEDTKEYEGDVVVSTEGSWQAGVNGAQPGIVMHAEPPKAGVPYRQEYLACEAEDYAQTVSTSEAVSVPFGDYTDCIQTREFTPLEPAVNEYKYYCAGVGLVLEVDVATGDRVELTDMLEP